MVNNYIILIRDRNKNKHKINITCTQEQYEIFKNRLEYIYNKIIDVGYTYELLLKCFVKDNKVIGRRIYNDEDIPINCLERIYKSNRCDLILELYSLFEDLYNYVGSKTKFNAIKNRGKFKKRPNEKEYKTYHDYITKKYNFTEKVGLKKEELPEHWLRDICGERHTCAHHKPNDLEAYSNTFYAICWKPAIVPPKIATYEDIIMDLFDQAQAFVIEPLLGEVVAMKIEVTCAFTNNEHHNLYFRYIKGPKQKLYEQT